MIIPVLGDEPENVWTDQDQDDLPEHHRRCKPGEDNCLNCPLKFGRTGHAHSTLLSPALSLKNWLNKLSQCLQLLMEVAMGPRQWKVKAR